MKKILIGAAALVIMQACNTTNTKKDGYVIDGKVENPVKGGIVKLEEMKESTVKAVDSVKVADDGTFKLEGKLTEEGFYRLNLFNKQNITLVLGNDKVNVTADGSTQQAKYDVKGSSSTDALKKVENIIADFQVATAMLEQEFSKAAGGNNTAQQDSIKGRYEALQKQTTEKLKSKIDSMGTSVVSLYAANFLNPATDMAYMEALAEKFKKERPDSRYTKDYTQAINNYKTSVAQTEKNNADLAIGKTAPDIKLQNPEGKEVALSSLKGKYVLIDFWASWCGPCRQENPNVVKMYEKYKGKNFEIYGVSLDQDKDKWLKAIEKDKLTWMHVSDLKGWQSAAAELYKVQGIPATFLLDKEGKIIARDLRGKALEDKLAEVL